MKLLLNDYGYIGLIINELLVLSVNTKSIFVVKGHISYFSRNLSFCKMSIGQLWYAKASSSRIRKKVA